MFLDIETIMLVFLFPLLMLITVAYLVKVWKVERYLEKEHPDLWDELGRPHLISNNSLRNNKRFLRFLKKKEYKASEDQVLVEQSRSCYSLYWASLVSFILLLVSLVISQLVPAVLG